MSSEIDCLNKPVINEEFNIEDLSVNELIALKSYSYAVEKLKSLPIVEAENLSMDELFPAGIVGSKESMMEFLERRDQHQFLNTIPIFEPSEVIGQNPCGIPVRASCNIAHIINQVEPYWKCALIELWRNGIEALREGSRGRFMKLLHDSKLYFMEGGPQSMFDKESFVDIYPQLPKKDLIEFVMELLLERDKGSPAGIFICLGHQAVAEALIWIIRKAVDDVWRVSADQQLLETVNMIDAVGKQIMIVQDGMCAHGYRDAKFATSLGEQPEIGIRRLEPYRSASSLPTGRRFEQSCTIETSIAEMFAKAHDKIAAEHPGVINDLLQSVQFHIAMMHSIEWNEEACLFTNWALQQLSRHSDCFTGELEWMNRIPAGVMILCSTHFENDPKPWTVVAATAVIYEDKKSGELRKNFTLQFHPELQEGLEDVITAAGKRKINMHDDGVRCLLTLAYHSAHIRRK